ncbi:MAG: ABC transporter substrate-binding protein, partial [Clostridium sp.]|nr:ABC transporter substrate-binding protein [Clostridium sp.]
MKKSLLAIVLACLFLVSAVGCSNSNSTEDKTANKEATRTVTDIKGEVTIPAEPKRIVDLSGCSDTLALLGYQVVGTCNSDAYDYTKLPSYLEDTLKDAKILGYSMSNTVNLEAVIALEPDMIIISNVQESSYDQLSEIASTVMLQFSDMDWK